MMIRPMKIVWGLLALAVGVAAAVTVRPDLVPGASDLALSFPFAQIVALRGWEALIFFIAAVFFLVVGIIRRVILRRGRIAMALAATLAMVGSLHCATIVNRGVSTSDVLSADYGVTSAGVGNGAITVMQYNTEGGSVSASALADLIEANGVDVVALVETSTATGGKLTEELAKRGLTFRQHDNGTSQYEADWGSTVVLTSDSLGEYVPVDAPASLTDVAVPAVVLESSAGSPSIIVLHTYSPSDAGVRGMDTWKRQIRAAYGLCTDYPNAIIAGDFNSTADHELALGLGSCRDAAVEAGVGGLGTWPTTVAPILGAPIDRIMSPEGFVGDEAVLVDADGSDHRGIIVRMVRRS